MPRFKSNNLQSRPKIKLLLQNLPTLGPLPPDPQWLPAIPKSTALQLEISGIAPG